MKTQSTQVALVALLALAGTSVVLAQDGAPGEPGYKPSKYPGVVVRSIPAPPRVRAQGVRKPNRGVVLLNPRRSPHPRGGGVTIYDVDPDSLPSEIAHITPAGQLVVECNDSQHKKLTPEAHARAHGIRLTPRPSAKPLTAKGAAKASSGPKAKRIQKAAR